VQIDFARFDQAAYEGSAPSRSEQISAAGWVGHAFGRVLSAYRDTKRIGQIVTDVESEAAPKPRLLLILT